MCGIPRQASIVLKSDFVVTDSASGPSYAGLTNFEEVLDPNALQLLGDFDGNRLYDCEDANLLVSSIAAGTNPAQMDMNGDGSVNLADLDLWRTVAGAARLPSQAPFLPADANLDGVVDASDFNLWNGNKFTATPAWCAGDFNADGFRRCLRFQHLEFQQIHFFRRGGRA